MKSPFQILALGVTALTIALSTPSAMGAPAPTPAEQAQIDQLKTTYPLDTCPVSGDKLVGGAMGGKPVDYLYTQNKPDGTQTTRLVRFCCKDCLTKFKRSPDKYLKTIDASSGKTKTPSST